MNEEWLKHTRPILEAFWHTKYFIQMIIKLIKYAKELETAPKRMSSGLGGDPLPL